jgi:hypothetical protein
METVIGIIVIVALLACLALVAKHFVKPPEGPLPDCCKGGNKNINLQR